MLLSIWNYFRYEDRHIYIFTKGADQALTVGLHWARPSNINVIAIKCQPRKRGCSRWNFVDVYIHCFTYSYDVPFLRSKWTTSGCWTTLSALQKLGSRPSSCRSKMSNSLFTFSASILSACIQQWINVLQPPFNCCNVIHAHGCTDVILTINLINKCA